MAATIISSVLLPILHRSIRPYLFDGAIGYYDNLYEGYGPFMTVRTRSTNTLPVRTLVHLEVEGRSEV